MPRYTVWSPHDGQPVPARNQRERDALISRGYLAESPEQPEEERDEPSGSAGSDSGDLPADGKRGRVRGRTDPVASKLGNQPGADDKVPPAAE